MNRRPDPASNDAAPANAPGLRASRRTFLGGAAVAAATAAAPGALAQRSRAASAAPFGPAARSPELTLLSRATFGFRAADAARLRALGYDAWLDEQLDPATPHGADLDQRLAVFDWLPMTADEMHAHPTLEPWDIGHQARAVRLLRATFSRTQLHERIVEFWTDHFNVYGSDDDTWILKVVEDRDVIRPLALGKFRDLLHASAKSGAMLAYLDNVSNVAGAPQENYAREVMELHTLGVDGPYTEQDVRELARCFTGWGFVRWWESGPYGAFRFRASDHDGGPKTVLGLPIPAGGGIVDGETVLDALADHPSTRRYVTTKLARWLLGYAPPGAVVDAAEQVWIQTDGTIGEVVRFLLSRPVIEGIRPWREPMLKRPFHWIVSVFRATGIDLPEPTSTIWQTWGLGQTPYQWPAPNGYPDVAAAWAGNLLPRWNQSALFSAGWYWSSPHTVGDLRALLGGVPKGAMAQRISEVISGGALHPHDVAEIQDHLDGFSTATNQAVAEAFELAFSSPSFQLY